MTAQLFLWFTGKTNLSSQAHADSQVSTLPHAAQQTTPAKPKMTFPLRCPNTDYTHTTSTPRKHHHTTHYITQPWRTDHLHLPLTGRLPMYGFCTDARNAARNLYRYTTNTYSERFVPNNNLFQVILCHKVLIMPYSHI